MVFFTVRTPRTACTASSGLTIFSLAESNGKNRHDPLRRMRHGGADRAPGVTAPHRGACAELAFGPIHALVPFSAGHGDPLNYSARGVRSCFPG